MLITLSVKDMLFAAVLVLELDGNRQCPKERAATSIAAVKAKPGMEEGDG